MLMRDVVIVCGMYMMLCLLLCVLVWYGVVFVLVLW